MLVSGTRRSSRRMDYGRLSYMYTQCFTVPKCALDAPLLFSGLRWNSVLRSGRDSCEGCVDECELVACCVRAHTRTRMMYTRPAKLPDQQWRIIIYNARSVWVECE